MSDANFRRFDPLVEQGRPNGPDSRPGAGGIHQLEVSGDPQFHASKARTRLGSLKTRNRLMVGGGLCVLLLIVFYKFSGFGGASAAAPDGSYLKMVKSYCTAPAVNQEGAKPGDGYELKQVTIIHRHGQRSAIRSVKGIPYESCDLSGAVETMVKSWPDQFEIQAIENKTSTTGEKVSDWQATLGKDKKCSPGELVQKGYEQLLQLGKDLRSKYEKLLPGLSASLPADKVYARTTNFKRVKFSTAALLTGVLGLAANSSRSDDKIKLLFYQDHPVEPMIPAGTVNWFLNIQGAPDPTNKEYPWQCQEAKTLIERQDAAFTHNEKVVKEYAGIFESIQFRHVYDSVFTHGCISEGKLCNGDKCLSDKTAADALKDAAKWIINSIDGSVKGWTIGYYNLLKEITGNMRKVTDSKNPVLFVLGGHDMVVGPLAAVLGLPSEEWPPLATHIVFELWKAPENDEANEVRILHDGKDITSKVLQCKDNLTKVGTCPLSSLDELVQGILDGKKDIETVCKGSS